MEFDAQTLTGFRGCSVSNLAVGLDGLMVGPGHKLGLHRKPWALRPRMAELPAGAVATDHPSSRICGRPTANRAVLADQVSAELPPPAGGSRAHAVRRGEVTPLIGARHESFIGRGT